MSHRIGSAALVLMMGLGASYALAKLPPPPPMDDKAKAAAEEKKAKDAVAAEKAKQEQAAVEDRVVKNYQENMRKTGKPIPKPVAVAAQSAPPTGGKPAPGPNTAKVDQKVKQEAAKNADKSGKK